LRLKRVYLVLLFIPPLVIGLSLLGDVIQDFLLYRQSLCIAQVYGVYRVQIFATPASPAPEEEAELTAVIRTIDDKIPHEEIKVAMSISREGDIIPIYASDPQFSRNGIFIFYYTFKEEGDYLVNFIIVGEEGAVNVEAPITVSKPFPLENYIIPAVFLAIPIIITIPLAYILRKTKQ